MTLLVLIFKTSSTLCLWSPSPNAASSTKMGSHIESYASISLCFILAYRASSLWTTFPTSHCKHTKSALLLRGKTLATLRRKGCFFLFFIYLFDIADVSAKFSSWIKYEERLWHHSLSFFRGALPFRRQRHVEKHLEIQFLLLHSFFQISVWFNIVDNGELQLE